MIVSKTSKDLKPVLMEGVKGEVKNPYFLIKDKDQVIYVVSSGRNGVEFNKTVGYFSNFPGMQTFQCLYGSGIVVMQRNDDLGEVKEFKVVSLNFGKQVLIPASWGMGLINTGNNFLVVLRNSGLEEKYKDPKPVISKKGFAYYVVEKKGEISFKQNPNYRVHPQIIME